MKNKICVYTICKNESQFVDRWVDSMKEADAIVVLDTGSTDDTVEKLRARGVKVEVKEIKPWRFDVARNESLKLVPDDCNILICTDLDEILHPGWAKELRDNWDEEKHTRASYKYIWSHLDNGEPGRVFNYNKIHDRKWIWKYPVHELLYNTETKSEHYDKENSLNLWDKITLEHFPDKSKSRGSYLPLLELRASEDPKDDYGLIYLSHEYYYRGKYEKSIETLNKCLAIETIKKDSLIAASCYLFIGDNYCALGKYDNAIDSYKSAIILEPTYREPYLNLADVYIKQKNYREAINYIGFALTKTYRHYSWLERDTSWTYQPYDLLCLAYYYNGDKLKALGCAYTAAQYSPDNKRLQDNIKLTLAGLENKDYV